MSRWPGYAAFYYEAFPIDMLVRCKPFLPDGVRTGGMGAKRFIALKENIEKEGLINPIIVEFSKQIRIAMGNNRVEVMEQLGHTHIKAVVVVRGVTSLPSGGIGIPRQFFGDRMKHLHPGDETWMMSQWAKFMLKGAIQLVEEAA